MVKWDAKFAIGVEEIDIQHHMFFNLCNKFNEAITQNAPQEWLQRLMLEIQRYAAFHFVSEENVMYQHRFPDLTEHKKHHAFLLDTYRAKVSAYEVGQCTLKEIEEFLFNWLALHITNEDKKFGEFLAAAE